VSQVSHILGWTPGNLTASYGRKIVRVSSIVDNIFIEADPGLELFLQQIDFVEETGCTAKGID
jgi:hypothetical protein